MIESKAVIIMGAGNIGHAALEIFKSHRIEVFCFLDEDESLKGTEIDEVSILGKPDDDGFLKYIGKKCDAFVASDDNKVRKYHVGLLNDRRKVMPVNAIHAQAVISSSSHLGYGNFINAGAIIGSKVKVSNHCLIHSGAILEHAVEIQDFVHIGASAIINEGVIIEKEAFIGSGAVIIAGVKIGKGARIGAGSVVIADVKAGATLFGNPAQEFKNK